MDMAQVENIPKTYAQALQSLAESHGEAGADDLSIFAAEDAGDNIVRLIHVSEVFPDLGGVRVYRMGSSAEFPFRSAIALVRPDQWARIKSGTDVLPADWKIARAKQVWPLLNE
jgi:hypothetical protein